MNPLRQTWRSVQHTLARLLPLLLAAYVWLATSPVVWAAKKKTEEVAPTKSYTLSYIIVMMVVGLGLMVICRPSSRADKVDEKKKAQQED